MGSLLTNGCSTFLMDRAELLPEGRELASHWATKHINDNPAYRWIVAKYVEADKPNDNMQMWSLSDLENTHDTVKFSPMNILHRQNNIVGSFIGTDMMYPKSEDALHQQTQPYVEVVGAFWRYYFPNELAAIEKFHNEGSLFVSMECVSETITFRTEDGREQEFDYEGPQSSSYGEWGKDKSASRQLNAPHFLGGALIFPPAQPGWAGAEIKELSALIAENEEEAEGAYESIKKSSPHLDSSVWEELMFAVMLHAKEIIEHKSHEESTRKSTRVFN